MLRGLAVADIGVILVAGAMLWIVSQRQTAIVGIVSAKDPCAGLTGAFYTKCREINPIKKITPASGTVKTLTRKPSVYNGPNIAPKKPAGSLGPGPLKCYKVAEEIFENHLKNIVSMSGSNTSAIIPIDAIKAKYKKMGYTDFDIECGYKQAMNKWRKLHPKKTKLDDEEEVYRRNPHATPRDGQYQYKIPIEHQTPIDKFVNDIFGGLAQAWRNLTQGRTAIGGQPTILTGSPSAPIVRPVITPVV